MTIGNELDHIFHALGERITKLENLSGTYYIEELEGKLNKIETELTNQIVRVAAQSDPTDRIAELVNHEVNERMNGDIAALESRVTDFENDMNFDPDDLRCDFETQIEDVRDTVSYHDDRLDDIECYKITEDEARDIATDVVRDEIGDVISEYVKDVVCEEINSRAVGFTEWTVLRDRVKELEARLNKPTLGARVLRWLREGPSAKELATKWYASLSRARV
jgi:hypothetical protein